MRAVTNQQLSSHAMAATLDEGIALAAGMPLREFMLHHTLLPYAVSFQPSKLRQAQLDALVAESSVRGMGAVVQKLVRNIARMKFCPDCTSDDLKKFGESYWHRRHQLDGALICCKHQRPLRISDVNVTTKRPLFPAELTGYSSELLTNKVSVSSVALSSKVVDALEWRIVLPTDLRTHYRESAMLQGYVLGGNKIAARAFARDLNVYFGVDLLHYLGCSLQLKANSAWAERMLRHAPACFAPIRHCLMQVFLDSNPHPSVNLQLLVHAPRPKKVNYQAIEEQVIPLLFAAVLKNSELGETTPIQPLLNSLGVGSLIKHKRHLLPRIDQWIQETRVTNRNIRWEEFRAKRNGNS